MDWYEITTAVMTSAGISIGAAAWLSRTLINHKLAQALALHQSELTARLEGVRAENQRMAAHEKTLLDGLVKQQVDLYLGQAAAQLSYEYDARKRLYTAIGPLRFQLLVACGELAGRIERFGMSERYDTSIDDYYGRSTLYRILRPIAIAELIEQQIAVMDFSVDAAAMDCLRFKKTVTRILSGEEIACAHPAVNWNSQEQHAFSDSVSASANVLICRAPGCADRIMRFDEFRFWIDNHAHQPLGPFPALLRNFNPDTKPILWARLVAYGNACSSLVNRLGIPIGFEERIYPARLLLAQTRDQFINSKLDMYVGRVEALVLIAL